MNRRSLLLGLGALIAAPAVVRIPGLLMPVREIPDRHVIYLHDGDALIRQTIIDPYRVVIVGNNCRVEDCTFKHQGPGFGLEILPSAREWQVTHSKFHVKLDPPVTGVLKYRPRGVAA